MVQSADFVKVEDLVEEADRMYKKKSYKQAIPLYMKAYMIEPGNSILPYSLGSCYSKYIDIESNKYAACEFCIKTIFHPKATKTRKEEVEKNCIEKFDCLAIDKDKWKDLKEAWELMSQGIEKQLQGKLNEALLQYQKANDIAPTVEGYLRVAHIHLLQGNVCSLGKEAVLKAKNLEGVGKEIERQEQFSEYMELFDDYSVRCPVQRIPVLTSSLSLVSGWLLRESLDATLKVASKVTEKSLDTAIEKSNFKVSAIVIDKALHVAKQQSNSIAKRSEREIIKIAAWSSIGIGVVFLGIAITLQILSADYENLADDCYRRKEDDCFRNTYNQLSQDADGNKKTSYWFYGGSALAIGVGVLLLVVFSEDDYEDMPKVVPIVDIGSVGLGFSWSF